MDKSIKLLDKDTTHGTGRSCSPGVFSGPSCSAKKYCSKVERFRKQGGSAFNPVRNLDSRI